MKRRKDTPPRDDCYPQGFTSGNNEMMSLKRLSKNKVPHNEDGKRDDCYPYVNEESEE
jgi:hypothetical protein